VWARFMSQAAREDQDRRAEQKQGRREEHEEEVLGHVRNEENVRER